MLIITISFVTACQKEVGFEAHLLEAIEVNSERAETYASLSQERTRKLSNALILSEQLLILTARVFDMRGVPFNKKGIGIIEEDFVPMHLEYSALDPVAPTNPFTKDTTRFIEEIFQSFQPHKYEPDFEIVADLSVKTLNSIEKYELEHNIFLPMLKHVIESIGFGAINAIFYSCQSEGSSDQLAKDLISLQIIGLGPLVTFLDREANQFHQEGIGILVNDLPKIPVIERYSKLQDMQQCQ